MRRKQSAQRILEFQSQQDRQLEERLRTAERIAQALREAGYSCAIGDDNRAQVVKPSN
jgi:hypothetical protein